LIFHNVRSTKSRAFGLADEVAHVDGFGGAVVLKTSVVLACTSASSRIPLVYLELVVEETGTPERGPLGPCGS